MRVVLYDDVLLVSLDTLDNLAERYGATYAGHVLEADFVRSSVNKLLGKTHIILYRMYWRMSDTERCLGNHAALMSILD